MSFQFLLFRTCVISFVYLGIGYYITTINWQNQKVSHFNLL